MGGGQYTLEPSLDIALGAIKNSNGRGKYERGSFEPKNTSNPNFLEAHETEPLIASPNQTKPPVGHAT